MNQTSRVAAGILCLFACCAVAWAGSAGQDSGTLILDESAYCRAYYQFDVQRIAPKALKAEGEKVLGASLDGQALERSAEAPGVQELLTGKKRGLARPRHGGGGIQQLREKEQGVHQGRKHHGAARGRVARAGVRRFDMAAPAETGRSRLAGTIYRAARRKEMAGCAGSFCVSASRFPTRPRQEP